MTRPVIRVVAALIGDPEGRLLLVRKRGTDRFMQAGGKPEQGESPRAALLRELQEELGLDVAEEALRGLGPFFTEAANEPGHTLEAEVFALEVDRATARAISAKAELEEIRWATAAECDALGDRLAPLARLLLERAPETRRVDAR